MTRRIGRRRAIAIIGAAAGLPLLARAGLAGHASQTTQWNGQALGAPTTLILNHPDRSHADRVAARVFGEVGRLERIFSLYRKDSTLSELNRTSMFIAPPSEMVEVLEISQRVWQATGGLFDPTVQPIWSLYAAHFSKETADPSGPSAEAVRTALAHVGFDAVKFNRDRIVFTRPEMALTLNGIAQGYITDRIVDLLRGEGISSSLVDMGEIRALGPRSDGAPWRVALASDAVPDTTLRLIDRAVATSSTSGFSFGGSGETGHIFDPRSGGARSDYRRLSVVHSSAAVADAYSTAFTLMDLESMRARLRAQTDLTVDLVTTHGEQVRLGASLGQA